MSNAIQRRILRSCHLIAGIMLALHVYSPLAEVALFATAVQAVIVPLVALSGLWMWQQPRISRWMRSTHSPKPGA